VSRVPPARSPRVAPPPVSPVLQERSVPAALLPVHLVLPASRAPLARASALLVRRATFKAAPDRAVSVRQAHSPAISDRSLVLLALPAPIWLAPTPRRVCCVQPARSPLRSGPLLRRPARDATLARLRPQLEPCLAKRAPSVCSLLLEAQASARPVRWASSPATAARAAPCVLLALLAARIPCSASPAASRAGQAPTAVFLERPQALPAWCVQMRRTARWALSDHCSF
jgi:hypothetical protein